MAATRRSIGFLIHLSLVENNSVVSIRNMNFFLIGAIILKTSIKAFEAKRVDFLHAQMITDTCSFERLETN